jgi:hypothetical protein
MSIARELARELQSAGYLVWCVEDLRVPLEDVVPILFKYVGHPDVPLGLGIAGLCRLNDRESLPQLREAARDIRHAGRRRKVADALAKLERSVPA